MLLEAVADDQPLDRLRLVKPADGATVRRLDEVKAAKRAVVKYGFEDHPDLSAELGEARQLEAQKGA